MSADTKTYLFVDPGRLLGGAWSMWDPSIGAGTVTHQTIGYLWPMGPYFWLAEHLGVPDWAAQRIWWGSILFAAGAGVVYLARRFQWPGVAAWPAAFMYALSPYVLTLLARLSGVLLPFAGLPWLIALTVQTLRHRGWRHPATFALVVATVGSLNLTALAMVAVGPALWLVHATLATREATPRQAGTAVLRLGAPTLAVSAWWIAGLSVQATNGIDILRYTETAEVVARTSTANEVLRGLGYWFFYGSDRLGPWIEPSDAYTQQLWLLAATYALPVIGLVGYALARWRHRAFAAGLVVAGVLLAVGAHPWDDPSLLGEGIQAFLETERGLALRSLPRAIPLVALGLALLAGAGVAAIAPRAPRLGRGLAGGLAVLAVLALPPLWQGEVVPQNLRREEQLPDHWLAAAQAVDSTDDGTRVLALPGSDFAAYRWGNTVDPIAPGLIDRPFLARELIPYGSPASANLLNALDLALQERRLDPDALAPVARILRAGDLLLRLDLQYERYNTPRPRIVWELVSNAPGLGEPRTFGAPVPNVPVDRAELRDEVWLLRGRELPDPSPVALVPVQGTAPIVSAHRAGGGVLVAGDGAGLVAAAAEGLIDGTELIRYSGSLDDDAIDEAVEDGAVLVLTDTNRRRGERWSTVRHTRGYTEPADLDPLTEDATDNRLPLFEGRDDDVATVAVHRGGITARATSYGNSITFWGEDRPANAVDGDVRTAWRTGAFSDARGERLRIDLDEPVSVDRLTLVQPTTGIRNRHLTRVRLTFDGGESGSLEVDLGPSSLTDQGQLVEFPERYFSTLEIELVADTAGDRPRFDDQSAVGLAEVAIGEDPPILDEAIRLPTDLLDAAGRASLDRPLAVVVTRIRQDSADPTRGDEEPAMTRLVDLPTERAFTLSGTARISARADEATLDALLGWSGPVATASLRLPGAIAKRASAAIDGDPGTAWTGPFGMPTGVELTVEAAQPVPIDDLALEVVADGAHSVPTEVEVLVDGRSLGRHRLAEVADSDEPGATATLAVPLPRTVGQRLTLRVTDAREVHHDDWNSGEPIAHPVAIAELGWAGRTGTAGAATLDTGCRTDLVTVDGEAVPIRIRGGVSDPVGPGALSVTGCRSVELGAGTHELRTAAGRRTGLDLDRLVLRSAAGGAPGPATGLLTGADDAAEAADAGDTRTSEPAPPEVEVLAEEPDELSVRVSGARPGEPFWLVLGQSFDEGWEASSDDATIEGPRLVDGFANGFLVEPSSEGFDLTLRFGPQRRVDVALWISALGALTCLGLLLRRPRRVTTTSSDAAPEPWSPVLAFRYDGRLPGRRLALGVAGASATGAALVLPPIVALAVGLLAWRGARHEQARRLIVLAPVVLVAGAGAYVVVQQARHGIPPGLPWVEELAEAHLPAMTAVVLVAVDVVLSRVWARTAFPSRRRAGRNRSARWGGPRW